jgi:hypothetical protein
MSLSTNTIRVIAAVLVLCAVRVSADTIFHDSFELCRVAGVVEWDGGGDGTSWHDPLNWVGDTLPADGDAVAIREPDSLTVEYVGNLITTLSCLSSTANLVVTNGILVLDGPATMMASLAIQGGRVTADWRLTVNKNLDLSTGVLEGTGAVTVNGPFNWSGGTHRGAGETIANGGMLISGTVSKNLSERTLSLNGASSWTGVSEFTLRWGPTINVNSALDIATDSDMQHIQGTNPIMNINGSLTKSAGAGLTSIGVMFNNHGSVTIESGELYLGTFDSPFIGSNSGEFTVAAGSTLTVRGNHDFEASSSFNGDGGFVLDGGTAVMQGNYALTGPLGVSGGTMQFPSNPNIPGDVTVNGGDLELQSGASIGGDVIIDHGVLLVSGPVTIDGALQQEPLGTVDGSATVTVAGLFTWKGGGQHGTGETVADGGALISGANTKDLRERTLSLNGSGSWTGSGALTLRFGPTLNVNAPFDIATSADMQALQGAYGILNINDSFIKSAGAGETQIGALIGNSGSIAVNSGQLNFQQSFDQSAVGALDISVAGDADFDVFPVGTAATLDGVLNINLVGGYEPALGRTFEIMTAASVTGMFASVNGTAIVAGKRFDVVYGAKNVTLEVVSE